MVFQGKRDSTVDMLAFDVKTEYIFERFVFADPFHPAKIHCRVLHLQNSLCGVGICRLKLNHLHVPAVVFINVGRDIDGVNLFVEAQRIGAEFRFVVRFPIEKMVINDKTTCVRLGRSGVIFAFERSRINSDVFDKIRIV